MKDQSVFKMDKCQAQQLARIMGFDGDAINPYVGRWVKIKIISGETVKGISGKIYENPGGKIA